MGDPNLEAQLDRILRDIRRSHSQNQPFYIELLENEGQTVLHINCIPDGITWLMQISGRVTMDLTPVAHNAVMKVCSNVLRIAFDVKWRSKVEVELKKKAAN